MISALQVSRVGRVRTAGHSKILDNIEKVDMDFSNLEREWGQRWRWVGRWCEENMSLSERRVMMGS